MKGGRGRDPQRAAAGLFCLFLDVDGTLLDIAPTPEAVRVDPALVNLLRQLDRAFDGALALISGRSIVDIDQLFAPLLLSVAGVHGCERRDASGHWYRPSLAGTLEFIRADLREFLTQFHGALLEDKGYGLAVHFRQAPHHEEELRLKLCAYLARAREYELLEGDHVIEIKPMAYNKGTAIEAFMQTTPFVGRCPIYIGNDTTDLDGFAAVRRFNGQAISVGDRVNADLRLADSTAVHKWLKTLLLEPTR